MGKPETIQEYLTAIEEQIRWKRARPVVALELQRHLEDQRDAFLEEGSTPLERNWTISTGQSLSGGCWD